MQKLKVSMRNLKAQNVITLGVGYCEWPHILRYYQPEYYCTSIYGWACDGYIINQTVTVVSGYNYSCASKIKLYDIPENLKAEFDSLEQRAGKMGYTDEEKAEVKERFEKILNKVWEWWTEK